MDAEAVAWTGIGIGALALTAGLLSAFYEMLRDPIGRAILLGWTIIGIGVWVLIGTAYLLFFKGN